MIWHGIPTLLIELFSRNKGPVPVESDNETIVVPSSNQSCELSRDAVTDLQETIGLVLAEKREFSCTVDEYRRDGSYVVSHHSADSTGNTKVFTSFDELRRLYDRLSERFIVEDTGRTGITGSHRHVIPRHFGEHPGFNHHIASRDPLTGEKQSPEEEEEKAVELLAD